MTIFKGKKLLPIALAAAAALVFAGCSAPAPAPIVDPSTGAIVANAISVSGSGKVSVKPDVVTVQLGVVTRDPNASKALGDNAAAMTAVVDALKKNVKEENISTSQLSMNPIYNYQNPTPVIEGYEVANAVTVRIEDLGKAAQIIDEGLGAGANVVQGITFGVKDDTAAYDDALNAAMADAKHKAETLAKAGGVKLGGVINIEESSISYTPYAATRSAVMADEAGAKGIGGTLQSGTLEITAMVAVEYALG